MHMHISQLYLFFYCIPTQISFIQPSFPFNNTIILHSFVHDMQQLKMIPQGHYPHSKRCTFIFGWVVATATSSALAPLNAQPVDRLNSLSKVHVIPEKNAYITIHESNAETWSLSSFSDPQLDELQKRPLVRKRNLKEDESQETVMTRKTNKNFKQNEQDESANMVTNTPKHIVVPKAAPKEDEQLKTSHRERNRTKRNKLQGKSAKADPKVQGKVGETKKDKSEMGNLSNAGISETGDLTKPALSTEQKETGESTTLTTMGQTASKSNTTQANSGGKGWSTYFIQNHRPKKSPTNSPTLNPSKNQTLTPTLEPSEALTLSASTFQSTSPTTTPTNSPETRTTKYPLASPTNSPTTTPTPIPYCPPAYGKKLFSIQKFYLLICCIRQYTRKLHDPLNSQMLDNFCFLFKTLQKLTTKLGT